MLNHSLDKRRSNQFRPLRQPVFLVKTEIEAFRRLIAKF